MICSLQGSFLDYDWSDGDVVFANSTCFDDALMKDMADQAAKLKPGAVFVTFTKGLNSKAFEVLERKRYKMSWGPATGSSQHSHQLSSFAIQYLSWSSLSNFIRSHYSTSHQISPPASNPLPCPLLCALMPVPHTLVQCSFTGG